ncbi:cytochrome [Sesamum alatum]|uniref:Cytochrome n=1 Tax=Sesamum alatum TaxID=300844 RepID=A0AAE1YLM9_9LAMI|nr:cytochrome [Sesamum alatum]
MILLLLAVVILPLAILFVSNRRKRRRKSPYPPGPPGLPFIGNLHQFDPSTTPHIYLWRLAKKYGPLMFMKMGSKPVLVISSPKIAKQVLKTHDLVFSSRPRFLAHNKLTYNSSGVSLAPYSESWRELRKICVLHLLSNKQVLLFRPVREDEVFRMIRNLSVGARSGEVADLSLMIVALTSTSTCRTAFGKTNDEGSGQRRFDELLIEFQAMQGGFFLSDYIPSLGWVDKLTGMISRLDKIYKDFDGFYQELIDDHLDPNRPKSANPDFLDLLIQLKQENLCSIDLTWNHIKAILVVGNHLQSFISAIS